MTSDARAPMNGDSRTLQVIGRGLRAWTQAGEQSFRLPLSVQSEEARKARILDSQPSPGADLDCVRAARKYASADVAERGRIRRTSGIEMLCTKGERG